MRSLAPVRSAALALLVVAPPLAACGEATEAEVGEGGAIEAVETPESPGLEGGSPLDTGADRSAGDPPVETNQADVEAD